jgi:hypothetical protein
MSQPLWVRMLEASDEALRSCPEDTTVPELERVMMEAQILAVRDWLGSLPPFPRRHVTCNMLLREADHARHGWRGRPNVSTGNDRDTMVP